MKIGMRFLEPEEGRDHGQVLMLWAWWLFISIEINLDNDVEVMVADQRPCGKRWLYETGWPITTWRSIA